MQQQKRSLHIGARVLSKTLTSNGRRQHTYCLLVSHGDIHLILHLLRRRMRFEPQAHVRPTENSKLCFSRTPQPRVTCTNIETRTPTFNIMSFQSYGEGGAPPQQGSEEQGGFGGPGAPQQQHQMGQQMDPSQQQNQYPGAPQPGPPGPGSQPGGDQKTTLW